MSIESYVFLTIIVAPIAFINGYLLTKLAIWMFTNKERLMSFSFQKFIEILGVTGGFALFIRLFVLVFKSRDRIGIAMLTAVITIAALSSFVSEA